MNKDTKKYFEESEGEGIDDEDLTNLGEKVGFYEGNDFAASIPEFEPPEIEPPEPEIEPAEFDFPESEIEPAEFDFPESEIEPAEFDFPESEPLLDSSLPNLNLNGLDGTGFGSGNSNQNFLNLEEPNDLDVVGFPSKSDYLVFDTEYYLEQNPEILTFAPFNHFLTTGAVEGKEYRYTIEDSTPTEEKLNLNSSNGGIRQNYALSGNLADADNLITGDGDFLAFDDDYYLKQNPDVAVAGIDPYTHFSQFGLAEDREHRYIFVDELLIYNSTSDVNQSQDSLFSNGGNTTGFDPDFDPYRTFDSQYYLQENPDVAAAGIDPYTHFSQFGITEGRSPNIYYDLFPPSTFVPEDTDFFDSSNNSWT